jgi:hypothetical protein
MEPLAQEVEQEDLALQVADAPSVAVNRVATYKEHTYVTSVYWPFVLNSKKVKRLDIPCLLAWRNKGTNTESPGGYKEMSSILADQ